MKKFIIVAVIIVVVIFVSFTSCLSLMNKEMAKAKEELLSIDSPDLSFVQNGTYTGNYETPLVKVSVEVEVFDHRIKTIQITRHDNGKGKAAESIVDDMERKNSVDVELVSGATMSSLVIRAAVIDALNKGFWYQC